MDIVSTQSVKKMTVLSESVTVKKKGNRFRIYLVEKTNRT